MDVTPPDQARKQFAKLTPEEQIAIHWAGFLLEPRLHPTDFQTHLDRWADLPQRQQTAFLKLARLTDN